MQPFPAEPDETTYAITVDPANEAAERLVRAGGRGRPHPPQNTCARLVVLSLTGKRTIAIFWI